MLDTFRKRDNLRPTTPGVPGTRPSSSPLAHSTSPAPAPRTDTVPAKPVLLEPAAAAETPPAPDATAPQIEAPATVSEPQGAPVSTARLTVGPDIKLKGAEITDCDTLIVEGQVDASMDSRVVEIAEQGVFRGKVAVDIAEIRGRFEGELTAHKQLVIRETGRVAGKIRYGKIRIDEGGEISGDIAATDADTQRGPRPSDVRSAREAAGLPSAAASGAGQR
jgi:cytoskeletal protein CcmA (bactofilin family)